MDTTARIAPKNWSEAKLGALPDNGHIYEVVGGALVMSPKNDFFHGQICARILAALSSFNRRHRLGAVLDSSTGFWMKNWNCRAPDVSFITKQRLSELGFTPTSRKFFPGAPDLAVEVLSTNNTRRQINDRLRDFFESGSRIVWIIDPAKRTVEVCLSRSQRRVIGIGGSLECETLLPGFSYPIADLFKDWDWD